MCSQLLFTLQLDLERSQAQQQQQQRGQFTNESDVGGTAAFSVSSSVDRYDDASFQYSPVHHSTAPPPSYPHPSSSHGQDLEEALLELEREDEYEEERNRPRVSPQPHWTQQQQGNQKQDHYNPLDDLL